MRKIILAILGVGLIAGAMYVGNILVEKNQKAKPKYAQQIKTVFVETVENKEIPIVLSASGNLVAKNKISLFSEVQGVLNTSKKPFKAGTYFAKGETLLSINSDEFFASLQSQKSNLQNLVMAILPDLRLDFPNDFLKWERFLQGFDMNSATPNLPDFSSDKEKYFVSGRGILTAYYAVKNLEVRYAKHQIKAPFSGVLTEALVNRGGLIRVGQQLGEFIDPRMYEMEVSISAEFASFVNVGNTVVLSNLAKLKQYPGKVVRVNGKVDQGSQTIKVFIEVQHADLKEGMFLEANLVVKSVEKALEIPRKLLVDNQSVYLVKNDSILTLTKVQPVYFGAQKVVIQGLENQDKILTKLVAGAFDGMVVKINTIK
jgi:membrane fusion protein, multidrug efflux system